nr:sulfite exporter TauE/SafE family protein [Sedimentibacter sp.]
MSIKKDRIKVYEMTCNSCENRVERAIKNLDGIISIKVSYSGQFADVEYDDELCSLEKIKTAINDAGYSTKNSKDYKFMGIIIIVAAILYLGLKTSGFDMESKLNNASYLVLFMVGVLTSIHCVGMCGGIMLSQSISKESKNKFESILPALLYNVGRVVSYTILGGIVGAIGSVFSLSITAKATMQIIAGAFMIMMGFNMAGFKIFRKFQIKLPHAVCNVKNKSGSPFIVGILNGLMPCGPLQTMQIFALGTGSALKGSLSMFAFSVGTVPLMLTFGALSGLLSKGYTKKILKLSGVLIIVLGVIMGNRGLAIAGINLNPMTALALSNENVLGSDINYSSNPNVGKATIQDGVQIINMTANNNGYTPNAFYVQKGIPVKWIIDGKELNTCNNAIIARSLNLEFKIKSGENLIEFTPGDKDINFSCWMGMISGVIKVVDKLDSVDTSKPDSSLPPPSTGPSCCARPIDDSSDSEINDPPSIYGDDITSVPTEEIIKKAVGEDQKFTFTGIGYELKPLIAVTEINKKIKLIFDLNDFDEAESEFSIVKGETGEPIASFTGEKGINEVEFEATDSDFYVILSDYNILGIIDAVNDLDSVDLEEIRENFLQ